MHMGNAYHVAVGNDQRFNAVLPSERYYDNKVLFNVLVEQAVYQMIFKKKHEYDEWIFI